jgi:hypothetical protein
MAASDPTADRWASRDLPALQYIVAQFETDDPDVQRETISAALGISESEADLAVQNLERGRYVTHVQPTFGGFIVGDITERALTTVGVWPTPETALDRIIAALEAIADNTDDEDTRTRARKILDGLTGTGRQLGIAVAGAAISGQIPGVGS